jgi:hypothetical protein
LRADVIGLRGFEVGVEGQRAFVVPAGQVRVREHPVGMTQPGVGMGLLVAVTGLRGALQRGRVMCDGFGEVATARCRRPGR